MGEVSVLRHFLDADLHIPGDTADNVRDFALRDMYGSLCDNVTHSVTEQDFHGNLRIVFFSVCGIHDCPRNTVCEFVRMRRVYFLKHRSFPFWL